MAGHFACDDYNRRWVNANKLSIERAQRINIEHDTIIIAVIKLTTGDNVRNDADSEMLLPNSSCVRTPNSVFSSITAWIIITNHQHSVFHLKHSIYQQKCQLNFVQEIHINIIMKPVKLRLFRAPFSNLFPK